jgi:hypothetical protein
MSPVVFLSRLGEYERECVSSEYAMAGALPLRT